MKKRFSEHSIDHLLLMPRAQLLKLIQKSIEDIRLILDPMGEFVEESEHNIIERHNERDLKK
jgi:dihydropteroate synthase